MRAARLTRGSVLPDLMGKALSSTAVIAVILALWGIGSAAGQRAGASGDVELVEVFRLGDESDPDGALFSTVLRVCADSRGNVYVADFQTATSVYVFSSTGEPVGMIGSAGEGPGEFRLIMDIAIGDADSVFVFDIALTRVSLFTPLDYQLAETVRLKGGTVSSPSKLYGVAPQGMVLGYRNPFVASQTEGLAPDAKRSVDVVLVSRSGEIQGSPLVRVPDREYIVTISDDGGGIHSMPLPFGRRAAISLSRKGLLYSGWSDEVNISVQSLDGSIQRSITRQHSPVPVTSADMDDVLKAASSTSQRRIRNATVPKTKPAYRAVVVDDEDHVWIQNSVEYGATTVSGVIVHADGSDMGTFELPAGVQLRAVRGGRAYGVLEIEGGAPLVVAYDINV